MVTDWLRVAESEECAAVTLDEVSQWSGVWSRGDRRWSRQEFGGSFYHRRTQLHPGFERPQVCFFNILYALARKCTLRSFKRIKLPPDAGRTTHNPLTLQSSTLGWQIRMTSFRAYGHDLKHPLLHIALSVRQPGLPQSANPALLTTFS